MADVPADGPTADSQKGECTVQFWEREPRARRRALLRLGAVCVAFLALPTLWVYLRTTAPGASYSGTAPPLDDAGTERTARLARTVEHLASTIGVRALTVDEGRGLRLAASWIRGEWEAQGYKVFSRPVESPHGSAENLEVFILGREADLPAIVVGAHYDTWSGTPGADDNASGVAVLLELSRTLRDAGLRRTVRCVAFANEEPPYFQTPAMGSLQYARSLQEAGVELFGMIALETLGYFDSTPGAQRYPSVLAPFYPDTGDFIAFVGNGASGAWTDRCIAAFRETAEVPSEAFSGPASIPGVGWSDHWSFWSHGYAACMVTDTAPYRNPHYHEPTDTPDTLDLETLARVAAGLEAALRTVAEE